MSFTPILRRTTLNASRALVRGGGGGPAPPPFVRLPAPSQKLAEESELLWNDSVAPEITIDFDAPHLSKWQALGMLSSALATLGGLLVFIDKVVDPASKKPTAHREMPFDGLSKELGGYATPK